MAQTVDLVVDERVLFDIHILSGYIRLGLVVIVIRHEILDGILGEKLAELGTELSRKRFVVRENERRAVYLGYDVCHSEGLTGSRNSEKRLHSLSLAYALHDLCYRLGLVARGLIFTFKLESIHSDLLGKIKLLFDFYYIIIS